MGVGRKDVHCHKDFRLGEVRLSHKLPGDWTEPQSINQKGEGFRKSFRNYFQTLHLQIRGEKMGWEPTCQRSENESMTKSGPRLKFLRPKPQICIEYLLCMPGPLSGAVKGKRKQTRSLPLWSFHKVSLPPGFHPVIQRLSDFKMHQNHLG